LLLLSAYKRSIIPISYFLSIILFSDELLPLCEDIDDARPLLEGLTELDSGERQNAEALPNRGKISPKVVIPGGKEEVYKSTLVSILNEDPHLSHDRYNLVVYSKNLASLSSSYFGHRGQSLISKILTIIASANNTISPKICISSCFVCFRLQRVRQRQEYRNAEGAPHPEDDNNRVSLFNDYAWLDRRNKAYVIGSLVRLVRVGDHGRQDYKRPVPYDDPKKRKQHMFCPSVQPHWTKFI